MKPDDQPKSESNPTPSDNRRVVYMSIRETRCAECGAEIEKRDLLLIEPGNVHICLDCGGLDRLVYLPRGNTALTLRATKHSSLWAEVLNFNRSKKRNERLGVLVEPSALEKAEEECLADDDARARSRERAAVRREAEDSDYLTRFSKRMMEMYPGCPKDECDAIATRACEKDSGRVGRSAAAKRLDDGMIGLAVRAHIRHAHTRYDELLYFECWDRKSARSITADRIGEVEAQWLRATV